MSKKLEIHDFGKDVKDCKSYNDGNCKQLVKSKAECTKCLQPDPKNNYYWPNCVMPVIKSKKIELDEEKIRVYDCKYYDIFRNCCNDIAVMCGCPLDDLKMHKDFYQGEKCPIEVFEDVDPQRVRDIWYRN